MAGSISLATLVLRVRRGANIENQYGFITDEEIVEQINYAISHLWDLLCEMGGQEFARKTWAQSTNTTDDTYPLPPDFYRLISVEIIYSNNVVVPIRPYMEWERARFQQLTGWSTGRPVWYRLVGRDIRFIPAPGASYTVNINGYPIFQPLEVAEYTDATRRTIRVAADAFDGINGWEEYPIWRTIAYCQAKEERDPSFAMSRAQELEQRIRTAAAARDAHNPERVRDVVGLYHDWFW